jgi:hypothetical protein
MRLSVWIRGSVLFTALIALAGCGSGSSLPAKPVHPVRGKLLIAEKPPNGAFIVFIPVNENPDAPDARPRATVGENGEFQLSTYGENDGAPVGEYTVAVTWPLDGRDYEDKLQGRYRDPGQTKLKAFIKEGQNDLPTFKLK